MVVDINSMVVGYVSYRPGDGMLCVGVDQACLVAGSAVLLRKRFGAQDAQIVEARFGEILSAIEQGDPYTFDRLAYRRFYPLAQKAERPWNLPHPNTIRLDLVYVGISAGA